MEFEMRVTKFAVAQTDASLCDETVTEVEIVDEAAGEFVMLTQSMRSNGIAISPDEWPTLRAAIDAAIEQCREEKYDV